MKRNNSLLYALLLGALCSTALPASPITFAQGLEQSPALNVAAFHAAASPTDVMTVTLSSLNTPVDRQAFSLALSSVVPSFVDNGSAFLAAFHAEGSETTFSSTPEPISMLLIGFGMILISAVGVRVRRAAKPDFAERLHRTVQNR